MSDHLIEHAIKHAKAYPFFIPETSYVVDRDGWRALDNSAPPTNPHRVIASGSNASPDRLVAKFKNVSDLLSNPISVTRAVLHDYQAVYSAHFTKYGSIPATLAYVPKITSDVFVTWLDDAQLDHMHKTESVGVNYHFEPLANIRLILETGEVVDHAHAYLSAKGCLQKDGKTVALSQMSQTEVLSYAQSLILPDHDDLDGFILSHIENEKVRADHTQKLMETSLKNMPYENGQKHQKPVIAV